MSTSLNRRDWLKSGALLAAGLTFGTGRNLLARPANSAVYSTLNAEMALTADMPQLRARLLANENPFGPSEKAKKAITDAIGESYKYAFMIFREFAGLIAKEEGVKPENILLGAGSTELLLAAAFHYGAKGGTIISADPSYTSLMEMAGNFGAKWEKVPLTKEYAHDLDAMEKRITDKTSMVYICNPNNPTGTVVTSGKLRSFCEAVSRKKPVFIDEAYIDYVSDPKKESMIDCVRKGQNVIVARTFSKIHAFAGLRIGYVVAQPDVIKELQKYCTGGMNISAPSVSGAIASYQDKEYMQYALKKSAESKAFLYKTLKDSGYEFIPSYTNFVLFPVRMDAVKFREEMMKRGVGVRSWAFDTKQWCRVSIGTMDEMQAFADAFQQLS